MQAMGSARKLDPVENLVPAVFFDSFYGEKRLEVKTSSNFRVRLKNNESTGPLLGPPCNDQVYGKLL